MKIKLNLLERLVAFELLNTTEKASLANWKIINEGKLILGLSDDEIKHFGVVSHPNGSTTWDPEKGTKEIEYDIPNAAFEIIKTKLKEDDEKAVIDKKYVDLSLKILA